MERHEEYMKRRLKEEEFDYDTYGGGVEHFGKGKGMNNESFKQYIVDELKLLAGKSIGEGNQYVLNINNGVPEFIAQAIVNMMYDNGLFVEKIKR